MDFNSEPYWDDFEAANGAKDKNYMRILFRPGYAVQARELTQIQSIIQNQLKNFGDYIFKDGSPVYGGHISLDTSVTYVKLQTVFNGVDISLQDFDKRVISNRDGDAKLRAKVLTIDETQSSPTLMVRYLRGKTFSNGDVIQTANGSYAQLAAAESTGIGSVASIDTGVFYVDGFFVHVPPQTIVLDAYGSSPTYKIGLEISDEIIDESADANLLDPAQSSFNYQAPGATRYKFALNLTKRSLDSTDDSKFFELVRVENGLITKQTTYPFSDIEKTLARRTYDESGDYTVRPFGVSLAESSACTDNFIVNVEPGKAYVKGFEFETQGTQHIEVQKARTTNTSTQYDLSLEYGNYLYCSDFKEDNNQINYLDLTNLPLVDLHSSTVDDLTISGSNRWSTVSPSKTVADGQNWYESTKIGTARIKHIARDSSNEYRVYLTDINLSEINTFPIGDDVTDANGKYTVNSVTFTSASSIPAGDLSSSPHVITVTINNTTYNPFNVGDIVEVKRFSPVWIGRGKVTAVTATQSSLNPVGGGFVIPVERIDLTVALEYSSTGITGNPTVTQSGAQLNAQFYVANIYVAGTANPYGFAVGVNYLELPTGKTLIYQSGATYTYRDPIKWTGIEGAKINVIKGPVGSTGTGFSGGGDGYLAGEQRTINQRVYYDLNVDTSTITGHLVYVGLDAPLVSVPSANSYNSDAAVWAGRCKVSISFDTKNIKSIVIPYSDYQGAYVAMNVSSSSLVSAYGGKSSVISDPNKDSLIFKLPEQYIARGSIANADYVSVKVFSDVEFSSGVKTITVSGNETFDYGTDGQNLSSTTANNNLIVVIKDGIPDSLTPSATNYITGFSDGTVLNLNADTSTIGSAYKANPAYAYVYKNSNRSLTIYSGITSTFKADIYVRIKASDSNLLTNNRRIKTVRGNSTLDTLVSTDDPLNSEITVDNMQSIHIDSSNGYIWFTDTGIINKTPGGNNSLYVADTFKLVKVYDSGNPSYAPNTSNAIDITNRYYLNPGQTLNYYDHSKIVLKPGAAAPKGQIVVVAQWYEHNDTNGYFDVDSYPQSQYENGLIPVFAPSSGVKYNLRDCIDFRPTRETGMTSVSFKGAKLPNPDESMELNYSYYLPRIDKLVLTKDRELKTLAGVASKYPVEPQDSENAMTLYKLSIPAYTASAADVVATPIDNRRYTMKDIRSLEARIFNMEYYTALSIAEKKATDTPIVYQNSGLPKEKYGILVDNFTAFNIADTTSPDFVCAMDNGKLFPYNKMFYADLIIDQKETSLQINDKTISLTYGEEAAIEQTSATSNIPVAPYLYGRFDGHVTLTPESDPWFSISLPPVTVTQKQVIPFMIPQSVTLPQNPQVVVVQTVETQPPEQQNNLVVQPTQEVVLSSLTESSASIIDVDNFGISGSYGYVPLLVTDDWFTNNRR